MHNQCSRVPRSNISMRLPAAPRRNSEIQLLMHPHPHPHLHSLISLSAPVLDSTEFRALLVFFKILPAAYGSEDSKRVHNVYQFTVRVHTSILVFWREVRTYDFARRANAVQSVRVALYFNVWVHIHLIQTVYLIHLMFGDLQ